MRKLVVLSVAAACAATQVAATTTCNRSSMAGNWMLDIGPTRVYEHDGVNEWYYDTSILCDMELDANQSFNAVCYVAPAPLSLTATGTIEVNRNCVLSGSISFVEDAYPDEEFTMSVEGRVSSDGRAWPSLVSGLVFAVDEDPVFPDDYFALPMNGHRRPWRSDFNPRNFNGDARSGGAESVGRGAAYLFRGSDRDAN